MKGTWGKLIAVLAAGCLAMLAGCSTPPRGLVEEPIYGPPYLSDWIEIDGRWEVVAEDAGGALLQSDLENVGSFGDAEPRNPTESRWIDTTTGDELWSRDDIGAVVWAFEGVLLAFAGTGQARELVAIDVATGETSWQLPESDLGECEGWRVVGTRYWPPRKEAAEDEAAEDEATEEEPTEDDTEDSADDRPLRLLLAGPKDPCSSTGVATSRTLLTEVDQESGAVLEPLVEGGGFLDVTTIDDGLLLTTWTRDEVTVSQWSETDGIQATAKSTARVVTEGRRISTFVDQVEFAIVEYREGRYWLALVQPESDGTTFLSELALDLEAGTLTADAQPDCVYDGHADRWRFNWWTAYDACMTQGEGETRVTVRAGSGDARVRWTLEQPDGMAMERLVCRPTGSEVASEQKGEEVEDVPMLIDVSTDDAQMTAHALLTGEVEWRFGEGSAGGRVVSTGFTSARTMVAVVEDSDGAQSLLTIRSCSGELISEREVSGVDMGDYLDGVGGVLTVVQSETTLLTALVHRDGDAT